MAHVSQEQRVKPYVTVIQDTQARAVKSPVMVFVKEAIHMAVQQT